MSRRHHPRCGTYQGYILCRFWHASGPPLTVEKNRDLPLDFSSWRPIWEMTRKASPATHSTGAHPRGTAIHQLSSSVTSQNCASGQWSQPASPHRADACSDGDDDLHSDGVCRRGCCLIKLRRFTDCPAEKGGLATKSKIVTVNGANHNRRIEMSFSPERKSGLSLLKCRPSASANTVCNAPRVPATQGASKPRAKQRRGTVSGSRGPAALQRPSFIPLSLALRRCDRPVMGDNVVHEPVSILHYKVRTLDAPC